MASESAKCYQNGVKIAIFLVQNRKNCQAAGAPPQAPFPVNKFLVTMSRL